MSRLAADHRVIFIEEPILDAEGPPRVECRMEGGPGGTQVEVMVPYTPIAAPGFDDAQLPVLLPLLEGALAQRGVIDPLVWLYTPMALPLIANLSPRAVIYDCMDELSAFRFAPAQLRQRENALMGMADLVLCGGPSLYEARVGLHPNLHCLPSAVDPVHFSAPRPRGDDPLGARAFELQGDLPRPRVGYFGVIDERMDLALVGEMAQARPDWQFIMVGPVVKIDEAALPRAPNVHWLGMQSYAQLPHLLAGWDVCLMPFALNDSTRFISPTKTLEYLAGGKPVVSTEVRDVVSLYGSVVRFGVDAPAFIAACEAIFTESEASRAEWQAAAGGVVTAGTWEVAAHRVRRWLAAIG
ncbi:MAG: glycosyltransferase, partial [Burkholderiaceae bacterium]